MQTLHLFVKYLRFDRAVIKPSDEVRISFTTLPSHQKGNFSIPGTKINYINQDLPITLDSFTKEILIIIRRKSYINGDPIIGKVLILVESIPQDQELDKEIDILEIKQNNQVIKVGKIGIHAFFDNAMPQSQLNSRRINSSYSMPALSEIPQFDLIPNQDNSVSSFFQNVASKFKKNKNFVEIDEGNVGPRRSQISGSKSEFLFVDPL